MDPERLISYDEAPPVPSLREVHRSISIPTGASFWRKLLAFSGPGFLVAVGYMDPGNWATDIAGGSRFAYQLMFVLLVSNLMAILLQSLAARLGWPDPVIRTRAGRLDAERVPVRALERRPLANVPGRDIRLTRHHADTCAGEPSTVPARRWATSP